MIKPANLGNDASSLLQNRSWESSGQAKSEQLEIAEQLALIQELEHRHNDLLERIAELETQVSRVLETWTKNRQQVATGQQVR